MLKDAGMGGGMNRDPSVVKGERNSSDFPQERAEFLLGHVALLTYWDLPWKRGKQIPFRDEAGKGGGS